MEEFKITIRIICLAAFAIGLINTLVTDQKQAKTVNLVTGLIFLVMVLNPILKSDYNFDFSLINNIGDSIKESKIDKNSLVLDETEKRLEKILLTDLNEREIAVKRLKVKCKADENGSVTITEIICELLDSEKVESVKGILSERIGNEECLTVY